MSSAVLDEKMRSAIRPKRNKDARESRLKAMQEDYQIPLKWAEKLPAKARRKTDCFLSLIHI